MKKLLWLLPLIAFLMLVVLLWRGLSLNPRFIPSELINKPLPVFTLPSVVSEKPFSSTDLKGKVTVLNIWATWCMKCRIEHTTLMDIAAQYQVPLYGISYKDDITRAQAWLKTFGNPYKEIGLDAQGKVAIQLGVYGTPETFIIDKHGIIRDKHIGVITLNTWQKTLWPLIQKWQRAA